VGNIHRYPTYKGGKVTEVVVYANYTGLHRFYRYVVSIGRWSPYEGGQLDRFHYIGRVTTLKKSQLLKRYLTNQVTNQQANQPTNSKEKRLICPQQAKNFSTLRGTQRLIICGHGSLPLMPIMTGELIHAITVPFFKIQFNIILPQMSILSL